MLGNLVNTGDLLNLARALHAPRRLVSRLMGGKAQKVTDAWSFTSSPPVNWWDIPEVRKRWNCLISGNPEIDYKRYVADKYFSGRHSMLALSLGCGTGTREMDWVKCGDFRRLDAYDLSEPRIRVAAAKAKEKGLDAIVKYRVADMNQLEAPEELYDIVFAESSLHHFSPLRQLLLRVNTCLKPDGLFIVNEFVGPTRFQWTDRQLATINNILSILPKHYKTFWSTSRIKSRVTRPSRLHMILNDPSEAVESSNIMPQLHEIFDMVEIKEYGGTILHMLFSGIAHNFLSDDVETRNVLRICFDIEDFLLNAREIQSDYALVVCGKRKP
jgi:ubiquinone/menaquinone biosynthesis C-methylase UbiE